MEKVIGGIVLFFSVILVLGVLLSFPVMWLWNGCLVPAIDGVKEITWLQGWGLIILCSILFKSSKG